MILVLQKSFKMYQKSPEQFRGLNFVRKLFAVIRKIRTNSELNLKKSLNFMKHPVWRLTPAPMQHALNALPGSQEVSTKNFLVVF